MGQPAAKIRRATYADLLEAPPHKVAELVDGTLRLMPRPAPKHARASTRLTVAIAGPFDGLGQNGPGGWCILDEPELHFPHPVAEGEIEAVVPDLAGWRTERMPELPETAYFDVAPDWVCEVLSKSTEAFDREEKMPLYAREGVGHAWLVDPIARTLEVFVLDGGQWARVAVHADRVRVRPFEAVELDLALLWA